MLVDLVIKRDAVDGDASKVARGTIKKATSALARKVAKSATAAIPATPQQ